jgi:hypothetical protein
MIGGCCWGQKYAKVVCECGLIIGGMAGGTVNLANLRLVMHSGVLCGGLAAVCCCYSGWDRK